MKKTLAILLISLACVLIALLLYKITAKLQSNSDRRAAVSSIPELPIVSISGDVSDLKDIATPMVLVLFNSECDFCRHETEAIYKNVFSFDKYQVVFVSGEPLEKIRAFSDQYSNGNANFHFAHAEGADISKVFGTVIYPNLFIYDRNGVLTNEFKGETNIQTMLGSLRKE